jgi:hypothetical protein
VSEAYVPPAGGPVEEMACAVCGYVVDMLTREDHGVEVSREWLHYAVPSSDGHVVVPVPVAWIRTNYRCDFCLEEGARWQLPVKPFTVAGAYTNVDDWAACDGCAAALRVNDWNKVIYRAVKAHRARGGDTHKLIFEHLYLRTLKPNITGKVRLRVERP